MTEFFENNFADSCYVMRVEYNQDFIQPLVVFPISNISYYLLFGTRNKTDQNKDSFKLSIDNTEINHVYAF